MSASESTYRLANGEPDSLTVSTQRFLTVEQSVRPLVSVCTSRSPKLTVILLSIVVLPILSVGCSTARHRGSISTPNSFVTRSTDEALAVTDDTSLSKDASLVQSVAYQADGLEVADNSPEGLAQYLAPTNLDAIPVPIEREYVNGLTLEAIEQMALANNPAIQQASAAAARAGGIRNQVGLKPNPLVGYNGAQIADAGTDQHSFFFEQTFIRGDKLAWNQQVIGHDVNAMNWLVETQRQRLLTDVRLAFYEALAAQKRLDLSREFRTVAEKGVSISEERIKANVGTQPDVLQSEIQLNEVELAIQQAEFDYSAALNELTALAGVSDLGQSPLVGELSTVDTTRSVEDAFAQIVSSSPLLSAAQARVDGARANLQRQRAQPTKNVTTHVGAGVDNGTDQGFVNLQLSVPLNVHNQNQGNIQAAHAEYCEATQNVERIRMSIRRDLARVMREYQVADATVQRYEIVILPKAQQALEIMQEAREAGEFDFLRVLTARRAYFDANIKYVVAAGQLAQANAKIDGLLLTGGLSNVESYDVDDGLRDQALNGQ